MEAKFIVNGKEVAAEQFSTVRQILSSEGFDTGNDYTTNPVVGAFVNGRAVSLGTCPAPGSEIDPIMVFDRMGRRMYRHSLCTLLGYAAKLAVPTRNLVIGHSLGDGFYFYFEDGKDITNQCAEEISSKMMELVDQKIDIVPCTMPFAKAFSWFEENGFTGTAELLKYKNDPEVELYKINDYLDVAFEPLVQNTGLMTLFELKVYQKNGLLLRYPVSSSLKEIPAFEDVPNLFEVFRLHREWSKMLEVNCVGQLNRKTTDGTIQDFVRYCEALQRRRIGSIADNIVSKGAKFVFISGPSSSGKTTFSKRLSEQLQMLGCLTIRISLDDYYKPRVEIPKNAEGQHDYECLEALKLDLFQPNMEDILAGKDVFLPIWSFSKQVRTVREKPVRLTGRTVFVIEGIHGLNPAINGCIDPSKKFCVYISALTQLNLDNHNRVSTTDNRIIRRIVRDNRTRGISALETLSMWANVEQGERKYIFPNQGNADVMFNSALDYELGVLRPYVVPLLKEVGPQNTGSYAMARRLLEFLENFYSIPTVLVPSDSLLREFIGQSDYE